MNRESRPGGDERIARVFRVSLLLLAIGAIIVLAVWLIGLAPPQQPEVQEAQIRAPEAPVREEAHRPPPVVFADVTQEAGVNFSHINGAYGERLMPETMGSGLAFIDYDRDGDQDLFLLNSNYWPDHPGDADPRHALFENDGTGHFRDVSEEAGLAITEFGMGVAVGDYDNDGWDDLFLTNVGPNRLLRNEQGRFRDVTKAAGVAGWEHEWSTGAAFLDYDNDGDLDLYVGNYVKWSREIDLEIDFRLTGVGRAYGAPNHFTGVNAYFYRNDGEGVFTDVSSSSGIRVEEAASGRPVGKILGVVPTDYDGDGWMDLFVANDTVRNFLFRNLGDGSFEEIGAFEGIAFDNDGRATGAMGIDLAYYRNDAELGVAIANFANEPSSLYVTSDGQAPFADETVIEGLGAPSRLALTFGMLFFDYDLDGRQDLLQVNGQLEPEINSVQPSQHYAQPSQLFWNCGEACDTRLVEVTDSGALAAPMVGRGAAYADIDADGDLDIAVSQNGRSAVLVRNDQQTGNHWLRLRLQGTAANRNAIGAVVELTSGGVTQRRTLTPARSYLSQMEMPITFGLGGAERVERLVVRWPGGEVQEIEVEGVDRVIEVVEPGA
ncbi:MAG: CRTAC1 family protein [Pseudomonadota bacterium]